jgi:hypothetical protein
MLERFIKSTLLRLNRKEKIGQKDIDEMYKLFPSLELIYVTDKEFVQISPNMERDGKKKSEHLGVKRDYLLFDKQGIPYENGNTIIKEPYISSHSGHLCITVIQKREDDFIFFDFQLERLLKRFHLYEENKTFEFAVKTFYSFISISLIGVALFLAVYGIVHFLGDGLQNLNLEGIFKLVIAFTLGLAIFDLGKTIFEQEVLSSDRINDTFKPKTLMNFTVSIIIALMIESLLIVFKISIGDHKDLIHALYLLSGTAILFVSFSIFYLVYRNKKCKKTKVSG